MVIMASGVARRHVRTTMTPEGNGVVQDCGHSLANRLTDIYPQGL